MKKLLNSFKIFLVTLTEILLIPKRLGKCIITWLFPQNSGGIMYSGDIWVSEWKRNSSYIGGGGAVGIPLDNKYEETLIQMFMISSLSIEFVHFFRLFQYSRKPCGQSVYVEPVSGSSSRSGIKSTISSEEEAFYN